MHVTGETVQDLQPGFGVPAGEEQRAPQLCLPLWGPHAGMPCDQLAHFKCQGDVSKIISFKKNPTLSACYFPIGNARGNYGTLEKKKKLKRGVAEKGKRKSFMRLLVIDQPL